MFFIASQLAGFFAIPSNCLLVLALIGVALLPTRFFALGRKVTTVSVVLLAILAFFPVGFALTIPLEERFPQWQQTVGPPTGIIVLGGAIDPSISFARGQVALNEAAERVTAAAGLARRFPQARVVFAGGLPSLFKVPIREADFAGILLIALGVDQDRLVLERDSRDTFENALFTRRLVKLNSADRWLLVTSATHMPRAMGVFRKLGFNVEAYPVDYQTIGWKSLTSVPRFGLRNLRLTDQAVHEWIGLIAYRLTGRTPSLLPAP